MYTKQQFEDFIFAFNNQQLVDQDIVNKAAKGLPVPDELFLTEDEIKYWRPMSAMTLENQMAGMAIDIRQQDWYVRAIQRKYCSCHLRFGSWCTYLLADGVELPREELEHLICLACHETPKRFVFNSDLLED